MKKQFFLWVMLTMMICKGFAQPSAAAPTPPTRNSGDVVSLFSGAYSDLSGTDWFPNWGQSTVVSDESVAGNATKLYSTLNYQGIEIAGSINVSTMQNLHVDIWTSNCTAFEISLINEGAGEQAYTVTPTASGWTSVDIALSNYSNVNLASVGQIKLVGTPFGTSTVYMDNMYFWKSANAPTLSGFSVPSKVFGDAAFTLSAPTSNSSGSFTYTSSDTSVATISGSTVTLTGVGTTTITATQAAAGAFGAGSITASLVVSSPPPATAAPTPPTRNAANVISMYSDAYSNVSIDTWSAVWDQADVSDVTVSSNNTKLYTNFVFAGVEFTSNLINATNMEKFHIDIWTPDANVFKIKFVDFGANGAYGGGDDVEHEIGYTPAKNQWVSYDIDLADFTGLVTRGHLAQMILVAEGATVYLDNAYFWRATQAPTFGSFTVPAKNLGDAAFTLTAPSSNSTGAFTFSSSNTSCATISGNTVTIVGAGSSIITATQAAAGAYGSGSVTATLVVTGASAPSTGAPVPPVRASANVIGMFTDAYANVSGTDWFPNWGQNAIAEDTTIAGNPARKYANLNYHGVQPSSAIDASSMSKLHVDLWTAGCTAFDFYLINLGTGTERKVTLNPSLSSWNSFDIDLTEFSNQGINLASIGQFKFVATPFGGSTVYLDNIYFWKDGNAPTISGFSIPSKVVGDAKFKITAPTSNSTGAFTYSSSNTSVATISNDSITIVGPGSSTITVNQAAAGGLLAGSSTALFIVEFAPPSVAAPIPPVRSTADVVSLYSNAYSNVPVTTWSAVWDQANISDIEIAGDATKKYTNLVFAGVEFVSPTVDASEMSNFHIDVWTPNADVFKVKFVDFGADGGYGGGDDSESELSYTPTLGGWNTYDIPMTSFSGLSARGHLAQMILVASNSTVYVDNAYFWKGTALSPTVSVTQPTCTVATGTITVTSPTDGLTFSINGSTYTNTTGVFTSVAAGTYNVTSRTSLGVISSPNVVTVMSTTPSVPGVISGTLNINQCDTLQTYSVTPVPGLIYTWSVTGVGNRVFSGQGTNSAVLVMKSAGIVSVAARKCTTNGPARTLSVLKAVPTSPTVFTATGTNVCNYTQSAFAITGVRDTFRTKAVAGATGYYFETPGGATVQRLNDTTITVVFADTTTATAVKVYSLSSCDTSLAKVIALTRTQLAAPTAITITSVNPNVCGARQYRYSAPALPAGALGYEWSLEGSLGEFASIDSGDINSQKIVVTYASNAAAVAGDSVRLSYTTGCGYSKSKASKMSNTALKAPTAPASITIQSIQTNVCGARKYRYIAPALPAASATAGAATGYVWSFLGSLSSTMTVDSGSLTSRILTVTFTSNAASAAGDSVRVLYTSDCGNSLRKASKLSNLALGVPAAPASITIQSIQTNVCGDRKYRYIAPVLPSATTTAGAASGYVWSFLGSLSSTMTIDSGSLSSRTLTVTYTSNAAAAAGDSVRVLYTSGCGNSLRKASKLSNLALNVPATPASVTIQTKSDVCGARKYRYIAPVLPSATTTAGAASGYLWTLPTGSVGSTGSLDSGSLSGRTIVIVYTSNAAATTDSIRVRYTSGCGNSAIKAQKLSNLVKTCLTSGSEVFSRVAPNVTTEVEMGKVYPNPNNGTFTLQARTGVISKSTATVQVIDMMGKVVSQSLVSMNQGVINTTINNNNLKNGVYMVKYIAGNTTQTIRMVVQK